MLILLVPIIVIRINNKIDDDNNTNDDKPVSARGPRERGVGPSGRLLDRGPEAAELSLCLSGLGFRVNPRKFEHGFRMMSAGIPYTLP